MNWSPIRQVDDVVNKFGTEERIKRFQSGELMLVERSEAIKRGVILVFKQKVSIASHRFVVAESFTKSNTRVKFSYIDERLLNLFSKTCKDMPAGELAVYTLLQDSHDPEIMVALGPQSRRFIKLGQFYQMIKAQGHGQEGPLLVNGRKNIAYVIDDSGAPWVVGARCDPHYYDWRMLVEAIADSNGWGCRLPGSLTSCLGTCSLGRLVLGPVMVVNHCRAVLFC